MLAVDAALLPQVLISGLMIGVLYALMALGITFIFSIMRMINWAMGEFYMIGSFAQYLIVVHFLGPDLWWVAVPLSAAIVFVLGAIVEPLLIRPMFDPAVERKEEYASIVTLALSLGLQSLAALLNGPFAKSPGSTFANVPLGPLTVPGARVAASIAAVLALSIFYLAIKRTWIGMALRAAAQSRVGVETAGVDIMRLDQIAFGLGVALAAMSGALLAPVFLVYPLDGQVATTKGFETVIIGGLGSIPGAVVAAILVGIVENLGATFLSSEYQHVYGFILLVLILLIRPTGLFGERERVA
jgi:branched-chain amino acid transport system permease protein